MIRRNRRWSVHILSLVLLCAQFGLVVHAATHLKSDSHAAAAQLCGHCLTASPLQNMVGGGAIEFAPPAALRECALDNDIVRVAPHRQFSAFSARAPPFS